MIVTSPSFPQNLRMIFKKRNSGSKKDAAFERRRGRLKAIREGGRRPPFVRKNLFNIEDQETLNRYKSKRSKFGKKCPECHNKYRRADMYGSGVVVYRPVNDRVDKSL